jgi:hypothetical protein
VQAGIVFVDVAVQSDAGYPLSSIKITRTLR